MRPSDWLLTASRSAEVDRQGTGPMWTHALWMMRRCVGVCCRDGARSAVRGGGHRALARTALWALPRDAALHASTKEPPQEGVHQDATGNSWCLICDWRKMGKLNAKRLALKKWLKADSGASQTRHSSWVNHKLHCPMNSPPCPREWKMCQIRLLRFSEKSWNPELHRSLQTYFEDNTRVTPIMTDDNETEALFSTYCPAAQVL